MFGNRDYAVPSAPVRDRLQARMAAIAAQGQVPLIVDAGANIGAASIWFEAHYPLARVLAVEPDPGNCALLRRNGEGRQRIAVIEAAIGGESGRVELGFAWRFRCGAHGSQRDRRGADDDGPADRRRAAVRSRSSPRSISKASRPICSRADTGWIDCFDAVMIELHDWMLPGMGSSASFSAKWAGGGLRDVPARLNQSADRIPGPIDHAAGFPVGYLRSNAVILKRLKPGERLGRGRVPLTVLPISR